MDEKLENPKARFQRLATKRTNAILKKLNILGNCSNRSAYDYTDEEVHKIFNAIEKRVKEIKLKFESELAAKTKNRKFKL